MSGLLQAARAHALHKAVLPQRAPPPYQQACLLPPKHVPPWFIPHGTHTGTIKPNWSCQKGVHYLACLHGDVACGRAADARSWVRLSLA